MRLIGRREECARIDRLLADARNGRSGTLVLRGEPGIGKSALLAHAQLQPGEMELPSPAGRVAAGGPHAGRMDVLTAAGVESEADLPFAALQALLRTRMELLELIPAPQ